MSETVSQEDLAIRAKPRPVRRFNRKTLMAAAGIVSLLILGAAGFALRSPSDNAQAAQRELYNTTNKPMPDAFNALPTNYADVPAPAAQLGPPLPGDFGAAYIGETREATTPDNPFQFQPAAASNAPATHSAQPSPAAQARASKLFFIDNRQRGGLPVPGATTPTFDPTLDQLAALLPTGPGAASPYSADPDPNRQSRKEDFLGADVDSAIYNPHRLQTPVSPYQVMAGTIIPASLVTGLNSDLPGQVIAQVTENVYDTATGAHLLIPQGTRLIGRYDSVIAFGQSRALVVWTRIIMPDGTSIVIDNLPGVDLAGYAGLKDRVNNHTLKLFQAAILSSVLSVASEIGRDSDDDAIIEALRDGGQRTINQAGQEIVTRQLAVQPTLTVRPGWRLRVIVNKDLVLQPYGGR